MPANATVRPRFRCGLRLSLLAALLVPVVQAVPELSYDLRLIRALSENKLFDYALLQVDLALRKHPDARDRVLIAKARTLYDKGDRKLGDETLAEIKESSPGYAEARLLVAEMAYRRNDIAAADQEFTRFFAKVAEPVSDAPEDQDAFRRAVLISEDVLKKLGKGAEAAKRIELLKKLKVGVSARQVAFLQARAVLDAEEQKFLSREPVNKTAVDGAFKALQALQWEMDGVAASSYVEVARAYIVLENYDKAIETLKLGAEFMTQVEEALRKERNLGASPMAGAFFYYGRALQGKAIVANAAGNKDEASKLYQEALKRFYKVVQDYPDSDYKRDALVAFDRIKDRLEADFGISIEQKIDDTADVIAQKIDQAVAFLSAKQYDKAAPLYLDALRAGRNNRAVAEAAVRLVLCYLNLAKYLEAEAIASYVAERFPAEEASADSMLKVGVFLFSRSKDEKDPARRADLNDRGIVALDRFVTLSPTHPKAPDIAFMIAENQYAAAAAIVKESSAMPEGPAKDQAVARAKAAYLAAVPYYQRLVEQFTAFPAGVRALYKLGWIFYSTDRRKDAIEAFLRYAEAEERHDYGDDRLEAKFRAAEQLMLGDAPADAIDQFTELLAWLQPNNAKGFDVTTKDAKRIAEDADSYLGWAYDLTAETYRPQLMGFDEQVEAARVAIREARNAIAAAERQAKQADTDLEQAKQEFAEIERGLASIFGQDVETPPQPQITPNMTEAERAAALRDAEAMARRIAAEAGKRARERLVGEKITYETEREQVKSARATAAETVDRLRKQLEAARAAAAELTATRDRDAAALQTLAAKLDAARATVATAEDEAQKLQTALEQVEEKARTGDAQAVALQKRVAAALLESRNKLNDAHAERAKVVTPEAEAEQARLKAQVAEQTRTLTARQETVRVLQRDLTLAQKEDELLQARLIALAKGLERNAEVTKYWDLAPEQRAAAEARLKTLSEETAAAFRSVMDKRSERDAAIQAATKAEIAAANERIARAEAETARIAEDRKPVQEQFEAWKRKAEAQFVKYLAARPGTRHAPENMARLGSVYLEFRDFAKAAQLLSELASKYPDSPAGKQALFNLGRAQVETQTFDQAATIFEKLLLTPDELVSPNLSFISDRMLAGGMPKVSLAASRELLRRSEDLKHPDQKALERTREAVLFRAAEACSALQQYPAALTYYEKLLKEKPNTGYYFDVKFSQAAARLKATPPDYAAAVRDLDEVERYATDPALANRAVCLSGQALLASGTREATQQAVARFQQVVLLGDASVPENQPWIELATYESARAFALLGDAGERDKMANLYRQKYPTGKFRKEIDALPPPAFGAPAAAPAPGP